MRVATNTFTNSLVGQLGQLNARQLQLQQQVSTGQKAQRLEDDPGAVREALDVQANARSIARFGANISSQEQMAKQSYGAMQSLKRVVDRANEIAMLAHKLRSPKDLQAYAKEIEGLLQQGLQAANLSSGGRYLFAGTRSDQAPFVAVKDATGRILEVNYQGNGEVSEVEIDTGVTVVVQVPGASGGVDGVRGLVTDSSSGADIFAHLISLHANLMAGDTAAIATKDRPALLNDEDNLVYHYSAIGTVQARLETTAALQADRQLALTEQLAAANGVDFAETLVRLNQTQTAYQAALQSGAKVLNLSLLDYLR